VELDFKEIIENLLEDIDREDETLFESSRQSEVIDSSKKKKRRVYIDETTIICD